MFEMFESYGKQITAFITQAQGVLTSLETEVKALREENKTLAAQVTRIEGAHMLLMEWIADIDDSEAQELADAATLAAAEAQAAADVAIAAAETTETVLEETEIEEEEMIVPVPETPASETLAPIENLPAGLPETPVPVEKPAPPSEEAQRRRTPKWI